LKKYGVVEENPIKKDFDPIKHEAVAHIDHPELDANKIAFV